MEEQKALLEKKSNSCSTPLATFKIHITSRYCRSARSHSIHCRSVSSGTFYVEKTWKKRGKLRTEDLMFCVSKEAFTYSRITLHELRVEKGEDSF